MPGRTVWRSGTSVRGDARSRRRPETVGIAAALRLVGVGGPVALGAVAALGAIAGLGFAVSLEAQPADGARVPKVLLIGIDGVRPDVLAEVDTPNLDALIADGAFSDRANTTRPTISGPAWSSMLIGVWPEKHGVLNNNFESNRYDEYPDFLTRLEGLRPELRTFAAIDWLPLATDDSGGPLIAGPLDELVALNGYDHGWAAGDGRVVDRAVAELSSEDPDAMFVYLGNPDETSHESGAIGEEYREAIALADEHVGALIEALHGRPTYDREDWLVLISTDHGRRADGGHGGASPEETTTFVLAYGPSVIQGGIPGTLRIVDIAVTAFAHLDVEIDPAWGLDGTPLPIERTPSTPIRLETADGVSVVGEIYGDLAAARAILLLFHQGGANGPVEYGRIVGRLVEHGYAAISIDQRSGGTLLGGRNRTADALGRDVHYCEAYPDLEAALAAAREAVGDRPVVAWGSSYSGALALRLATEHTELAGVLAFSPAGGEAMGECPASRFAPDVEIPTLVLRPASEMEIDYVRTDWEAWGALGFERHVARPGRHGSSMLNPARVEGDVEPTWTVVLRFLDAVTSP